MNEVSVYRCSRRCRCHCVGYCRCSASATVVASGFVGGVVARSAPLLSRGSPIALKAASLEYSSFVCVFLRVNSGSVQPLSLHEADGPATQSTPCTSPPTMCQVVVGSCGVRKSQLTCLAHSMGGLISLMAGAGDRGMFQRLVVCSPMIKMKVP